MIYDGKGQFHSLHTHVLFCQHTNTHLFQVLMNHLKVGSVLGRKENISLFQNTDIVYLWVSCRKARI